jgi:hypothetical protein
MAEEDRNENGSKDRATVALVDAKVDGLKDLIRAEFANVKEDVRALAAVVSDVIKQGVQLDDHERRLQAIESNEKDKAREAEATAKEGREYRKFNLPSLIFAGLAALVAIISLISQFH